MKIIIVDDDNVRRASLVSFFLENKITSTKDVFEADCIDNAKLLLERFYFDALILDVVLPKRFGDTATAENGLTLLGQLTRSTRYKKPEKIIGLTAHLSDIQAFRNEFEAFCFIIIEANLSVSVGWKSKLLQALTYANASRLSRAVTEERVHCLTIHGIQTFGAWQHRLKSLVERNVPGIPFHSYNYGYFSIFAFFFPPVRGREIKRLSLHLQSLFAQNKDAKFIVFSHSFGTYLVVNALKKLIEENASPPVKMLVLSGSVLRRSSNFSLLTEKGIRIVNECADDDYVLWLSELFILGTGMAGKAGFYGFQNSFLVNRFYRGGHSSYFDNEGKFMEEFWLPLFQLKEPIKDADFRSHSLFRHAFLDKLISLLGGVKPIFYVSTAIFLIYKASAWAFHLWH